MIELARYHRLKPRGLAQAGVLPDGRIEVTFKRFNHEDGREEKEPERSLLTVEDLEKRLEEIRVETEIIKEFLAMGPRG